MGKRMENRAVPPEAVHKHIPGDALMERKPDMELKIGKTTVKIFAPLPQAREEVERILDGWHAAAWAIVDELIEQGVDVTKLED